MGAAAATDRRHVAPRHIALIGVCAALLLAACAPGPPPLPNPNRDRFNTDVFPVLARRCAFPACHGKAERVLRIYAPGRVRLDPMTFPQDPLTQAESDEDFDSHAVPAHQRRQRR